jgi:hypothetical protein
MEKLFYLFAIVSKQGERSFRLRELVGGHSMSARLSRGVRTRSDKVGVLAEAVKNLRGKFYFDGIRVVFVPPDDLEESEKERAKALTTEESEEAKRIIESD